MGERLELPRPLRLLRISGWNLAESLGFPVAAWAVGTAVAGHTAGLWAMVAVIWVAAAVRWLVTRSVPALVWISAIVLTVQTAAAIATGQLWVFLIHFPIANFFLAVLFARTARGNHPLAARLAAEVIALRQPAARNPGLHRFFQEDTWLWAGIFLMLAASQGFLLLTIPAAMYVLVWAVSTAALLAAGVVASALWFRRVLCRLSITLCFEPAATAPDPGRPSAGNQRRQRTFTVHSLPHRAGDGTTTSGDAIR